MGAAFLAPIFLAGLLALAVPVIIHLRHRERAQVMPFPSLMFLERIPYRSFRRRRLHNLLLLALRALAFALLAIAFARPFLPRREGAVLAGGGARERVILLDASYSMGYGGHFERARAEARKAVESLGPADRGALIVFSERAEGRVPPTADRDRLLAGIDEARLSSGGTRYAPALKLAADWLAASDRPHREAVLLTDFQKVGYEGLAQVRLPQGTSLSWVDLSEREPANVAVTDLVLDRDFADGRERVKATARLANKGARAFRDARVILELGGRTVEEKRVTLEPGSAASVAFAPFAFPAGETRGLVRFEGDALAADDVFHFVLAPGREVPVLVVEGETGALGSLYLRRALEIGDRPRFKVERRRAGELGGGDLPPGTLVVLLGPGSVSDGALRVVRRHVEQGGGALLVLGDERAGRLSPALSELLGGAMAGPVDRAGDRGATLAALDYDHPVFTLFKVPRSGDFSQARFLRYRSFKPPEGARALARFDDGSAALVEVPRGKGRLLVWTSGLDGQSSDLVLQPVFLPFAHELAKYLSGHAEVPPWRRVSEVAALGPNDGRSLSATVVTPSGTRRRLGAGERLLELEEAGFYEVRLGESGAPRTMTLAANVGAAESDLARLDPEELAGAVRQPGETSAAGSLGPVEPHDLEARQSIWWYLLGAALLLLAAETALSNRRPRREGA
jgi:aerotolerance regulator-like protein/VWA domain-containing protein